VRACRASHLFGNINTVHVCSGQKRKKQQQTTSSNWGRERIIAEINARDATVLSTVGMNWNKMRQTMAKLDGATDGKSTPSFCPQTERFEINQRGLIDAYNAGEIGRTK
jgi:hypothetical protein